MSKVHIQQLGKVFGTASANAVPALQEVNLVVEDGEFVTLVGASGCGKSTLLRILAGLEHHSSGSVHCNGAAITGPSADRAMVFQHYSLYPWLNVMDNIKFSRRLRVNREDLSSSDVEAASGRADALLDLIGLGKVAKSYPNQLSGGMQQRVAIARALMGQPAMLLMDEPFGALDAQTREVMHDLILHVFKLEKATIVFVTHDVEEAIFLADRIVVFSARPARVLEVLDVNAAIGTDRTFETKESEAFFRLRNHVLHLIRDQTRRASPEMTETHS